MRERGLVQLLRRVRRESRCTSGPASTHAIHPNHNLIYRDVEIHACQRSLLRDCFAGCRECGLDQRKLYCDPVPNTLLAIGGCDKPGECTTATGRVDVYGVLQEDWTNGSTLALPRGGAAAAQINGNLGFGPRVYITGGKVSIRPMRADSSVKM